LVSPTNGQDRVPDFLLMRKTISWSWKVGGGMSELSQNPLSLWSNASQASSRMLPCSRNSFCKMDPVAFLRCIKLGSISGLTSGVTSGNLFVLNRVTPGTTGSCHVHRQTAPRVDRLRAPQ